MARLQTTKKDFLESFSIKSNPILPDGKPGFQIVSGTGEYFLYLDSSLKYGILNLSLAPFTPNDASMNYKRYQILTCNAENTKDIHRCCSIVRNFTQKLASLLPDNFNDSHVESIHLGLLLHYKPLQSFSKWG